MAKRRRFRLQFELQIIPHWFMHFPKSKIHKELGHCPDAGYPKMAKVELRGCPEMEGREAAPPAFQPF